jgi:hypothetical protein
VRGFVVPTSVGRVGRPILGGGKLSGLPRAAQLLTSWARPTTLTRPTAAVYPSTLRPAVWRPLLCVEPPPDRADDAPCLPAKQSRFLPPLPAAPRAVMDRLSGAQLRLACSVLHERYKTCVASSLVKDVLASADAEALNRKCAPLFADLTEHCSDLLRAGELQVASAGAPPAAAAAGRAPGR